MTIPLPSLQFVLKNAKFFASKILSFPLSPHSSDALQAIDSPVSDCYLIEGHIQY